MRPLDCQTSRQMSDRCFRCIVWGLWLRHVDNGTGHASYHHNASRLVPFHKMLGHPSCKQISAVDIHPPEFFHTLVRVGNGIVVFGEACGGDQMIDLAMLLDNVGQSAGDRIWIRNIRVVCRDLGDP